MDHERPERLGWGCFGVMHFWLLRLLRLLRLLLLFRASELRSKMIESTARNMLFFLALSAGGLPRDLVEVGPHNGLPLDDFVNRPEPVSAWYDMQARVKPALFGGTAYILNVTSLTWLDTSK
eukprot:3036239-Prymnesium_polylepis.1